MRWIHKMDEIKVEEKQIVENVDDKQAEQIVETPLQTFRQKIEEGTKQVEEILYGDGEYFSL